MTDEWKRIADRLDKLLERFERLLPPATAEPDWKATAFRWRKNARGGYLEAVRHPHTIRFADLKDVDDQKRRLRENTAQFVAGRPANNVLLTGARGTGKSSLVKAALNEFGSKGLRLIEVDKGDLVDLPDIVDLVGDRKERFVDLLRRPFLRGVRRGLQVAQGAPALDGSIAGSAENVLIYAPSNRRHPHARSSWARTSRRSTSTARSIRGRPPRRRSRSRSASVSGFRSTRSTRSSISRSSITGSACSAGRRARNRARLRSSGRWSAARAAAALPGNSLATGLAGKHPQINADKRG